MAQQKKQESSSFFTRTLIAAPIVGGVGVGARSLLNSMKSSQYRVNTHSNDFLRSFAAKVGGPTGPFSGNLGIMEGADPEMVKMAWEMAMQQADPGMVLRRMPLDSANPQATIQRFADLAKSLQEKKVVQSFVRQLGGLKVHSVATGGQFSAAMFGQAKSHNFIRSNKAIMSVEDDQLRHTLLAIRDKVKEFPGAEVNLKSSRREGLDGEQLMLHMSGGKFGRGVALEIPMEIAGQPGVIAHGVTLQTKRIVGQYDIIANNRIKTTLKHEHAVTQHFLNKILPGLMDDRLSSSAVRRGVTDYNYEAIKNSQYMPNIPKGLIPAHDAALTLGGHRRVMMDEDFNRLTAKGVADAVGNPLNQRFSSTSGAQIANGVASSFDGRKLIFGGEFFPIARRPMQAHARGYGPSARAKAARLDSAVRKQFGFLHTDTFKEVFGDDPVDVLSRTLYVSEKKHPGFAEHALGGTLGGTGWRSSALNPQLEHNEALSLNISKGPKMNAKLAALAEDPTFATDPLGLSREAAKRFEEGEILGYDKNRNPVHWKPDMKITGGFSYTDRDSQFLHLYGTKTSDVGQHGKFYLAGKAVLVEKSQLELEAGVEKLTGQKVNGIADGIRLPDYNVVLGMDELKKNRALHNTQMITALHDFSYRHMKSRHGAGFKADKFNSSFNSSIQEIMQRATAGKSYDPDEVIKGVHGMSRKLGLDEFAMGRVFGAVPHVLGKDHLKRNWHEQLSALGVHFSAGETGEIEKGMASGVGQFFYGGPTGTGGLGSVEPRVFELLQGSHYGSLGKRVSDDIAKRMILSNPDIVAEQSTLGASLKSIVHGVKPMEGVGQYSLANMTHEGMNEILTKGGILDTGGLLDGVGKMYVPGTEKSISMREYVTPEGLSTHSELEYAFRDFLETGFKASKGEVGRAHARASFNGLIGELGKSYTGTITGKGTGLARGSLTGSRYLGLISSTEKENGGLFRFAVSKEHAEGMMDELEKVHAGDAEELAGIATQRKRLLNGGSVGALIRRDPAIGPYQASMGEMYIDHSLNGTNSIKVPQKTVTVSDLQGNVQDQVSIGPLPGQAADFDGDAIHIMAMSSKIEKDVAGHFSIDSNRRAYEDYIIRQQLIKAKAPPALHITELEKMIADTQKLATAKTHVGPLSVPMRELRASLSQFKDGISEESRINTLAVLDQLEQGPISAKHVSADRIDQFTRQMTQLATAAKAGRGAEMTHILQDTLEHNPDAQAIFNHDQEVMIDGERRVIKKIDLGDVGQTIAKAHSNLRTATGEASEGLVRSLMNRKQSMTQKLIEPFMRSDGGILSQFKLDSKSIGHFAQENLHANVGGASNMAEMALAVRNKAASLGGDVIGHLGKPLAIGFGAALAMSAILSKPISNLDPGASAPPTATINSVNRQSVSPENIHPDSEVSGEPTIPNMSNGPSIRHADSSAARIHLRGTNTNGTNMGAVSSAITQRLRGNTNINVNIRDRKTSLSQQRIDSITRR